MKKIIFAVLLACFISVFAYGEEYNNNCVTYDFTAEYSEDKADMLGIGVKDGFHVNVTNGKLCTISTFGIPVSFKLSDERIGGCGYAVFMLKCGYVNENSVLTMRYKKAEDKISEFSYDIPNTEFNLYCVKLPDAETTDLEIFVNSVREDMEMYSVELDYISFYKSKPIILTVDGKTAFCGEEIKELEAPAVIRDDFTLTPARFIAENAGADVSWNDAEKSVTITKDKTVIKLTINSTVAYINGEQTTIDVAPRIIDGFTYTPARFIAEALGLKVSWDPVYRTVLIF